MSNGKPKAMSKSLLYAEIAKTTGLSRKQVSSVFDATNELSDGRGLAEVHDGADHGFAVPGGAYHEAAADRSYDKALEIFATAVA